MRRGFEPPPTSSTTLVHQTLLTRCGRRRCRQGKGSTLERVGARTCWKGSDVGGDPWWLLSSGMLLLRSGTMDCWEVAGIRVEQGEDGFVRVERLNRWESCSPIILLYASVNILHFDHRGDTLVVKTSPTNGRIKVTSEFLFATASRGNEEHVYIRLQKNLTSSDICCPGLALGGFTTVL